jgi:SAM-dependent methyltransferase
MEGKALCLFAEDGVVSDVAVRVVDEKGTPTAQFSLRGACPLAHIEVSTYSRDHAFLLRATAAECCVVPLQSASRDDGQRASAFGAWLKQRNKFANAGRGAWLRAAAAGGLELVVERGALTNADAEARGPSSPAFPPPPELPPAMPPALPPARPTPMPPPMPAARPDNDNQRAAADFYNSLKRTRTQGERRATQIYHMRRLNNWVKAEIITNACRGKEAPAILDLACGKGGDLGKFIRSAPGLYVGVDIAKNSLEDAVERLRGDSRRWGGVPVTLVEASLGGASILEASSRQMYENDQWATETSPAVSKNTFDVASMQFALHYMFEAEERASQLFEDVYGALKPGGTLVATTVNCNALVARILSTATKPTEEMTPPVCAEIKEWYVCCIDHEPPLDARGLSSLADAKKRRRRVLEVWLSAQTYLQLCGRAPGAETPVCGLRYWFRLLDGDAETAVDAPEWLAPRTLIDDLAQKAGLRVDAYEPFADYIEARAQTPEGRASLERMGVPDTSGSLSQAEWDVASLYVVLRITKPIATGPDPMALAFGKVKRAWGNAWDALKGSEKLGMVQQCAAGQGGWEPPPVSLAVDNDFGDDSDDEPAADRFGDDDEDEEMLGPSSPAFPPPDLRPRAGSSPMLMPA